MWKKTVAVCLLIAIESKVSLSDLTTESGSKTKKQVCVIGAGASGLASARHLSTHDDEFDFVVFDKNSDIGGVWIYSDNIDVDEHNMLVHSSMYKNLRTNLPKELMAFPDFRNFSGEERSCVTHETVLAYLKNYTDHFDLRKYIQLNTLVENVTPIMGDGDWRTTKWLLKKKNLNTNETSEITCDAVMVCNGHYFEPRTPKILGIETFPGKIIHSHIYRKPEDFTGQTVAILGASFSGIDISIEISEKAKIVYLSHHKPKIEGLPNNIIQVPGVISANGSELTLKNGSTITVDSFVYCTGFLFSYPFLDENSGIKVIDNHVQPLYKQLVNVEHPSMSFIGLPLLVVHFPQFSVQAKYYAKLLAGRVQLPNKTEMLRDSELPEGRPSRYAHLLGPNQWAYNDALAKDAGFDPLPEFYKKAATIWLKHRGSNVWHYKESDLHISGDGDTIDIVKPSEDKKNV